jgi:hypothetical protein
VSLARTYAARQKASFKYLLHLEYWVYLPGETLPPQDEIMTLLVRPLSGAPSISGREAILFSDVRLHIALVLRSKNAYLFRPDILHPSLEVTEEQLLLLADSRSFAKVRFLSEEPVRDDRYLKFLPAVARAIAELGGGQLILDTIGERLLNPEILRGGEVGPTIRWVPGPTGGHVETIGLKKRGVPEIRTEPIEADERWIVAEIIEQVARSAWDQSELSPSAMATAYDDQFRVDLEVDEPYVAKARIHRIQSV